jgi:hypothetical protein
MAKINIKILMNRKPSTVNKKILEFLMRNVNEYKTSLAMSISTISRKDNESLDSDIKSLPAAYINGKVSLGYKNIINEINSAYKNAKLQAVDTDPIQSFWENTMKDGMEEKQINSSDIISSRFTDATKKRNNVIAGNSGKFKGGKNSNNIVNSEDDEKNHVLKNNKDIQKNKYDYGDDPAQFETDPDMKKFWENQRETVCD